MSQVKKPVGEMSESSSADLDSDRLTCVLCNTKSTGLWETTLHVTSCAAHARACPCSKGDLSDKGICVSCIHKLEKSQCPACGTELWRCPFCRGFTAAWSRTLFSQQLASMPVVVHVDTPEGKKVTVLETTIQTIGELWDLEDMKMNAATPARTSRSRRRSNGVELDNSGIQTEAGTSRELLITGDLGSRILEQMLGTANFRETQHH